MKKSVTQTLRTEKKDLKFSDFDQHVFKDVSKDLRKVFHSRSFVEGIYTKSLEQKLSERYLRPVAVTNSGTTALILALDVLLRERKEVIVPSLTFNATIQAIIHAGGVPVFVDVDEKTWTIDTKDVANNVTEKTGVILPVNLFGVPSDIKALQIIAESNHIPLLYDSCQAFGSWTPYGEIGTFGDIEVFSLDATKVVSGGLGGFVTMKDEKYYRKIKNAKNFGNNDEKIVVCKGINGRMSEFNSILALKSLETVDARLVKIKENVLRYNLAFSRIPNIHFQDIKDSRPAQEYFGIFIDANLETVRRIIDNLIGHGIETRIYNSTLIHRSKFFTTKKHTLPKTEKMHGRLLCLPTHAKVNDYHVDLMAKTLMRCLK